MAETTKQLQANLDGITAKVLQLESQMSKLSKTSDEYKTKQRALVVEMKAGEKAATKLAVATQKLNLSNKNHKTSLDGATTSQRGWNAAQAKGAVAAKVQGNAIRKMFTRIRVLGNYLLASAGISAGILLLNEAFIKSAKRAIALEKAMADVGAVAGLTDNDLKKLTATAFRVAGATSLTVIEVARLQKELAKLGLSTEDIEKLTKPVALLSQALGVSSDVTASTLQKIQNQFVLTADTATQTANSLVGAVNESALTLTDLATGLQYVGPLAAQAGQSFEETSAQLGVLADNGFKASRAGTGLRTVLIEAAKQGRPVEELLRELAASGLSVARATELFTKRGAAAAITLAQQYDKVNILNDSLRDSDRLFNANAKQMGTTAGQLQLLASAYNKASTSLGEYITKTDFFINLTYNLDKAGGSQAAAYKFIAENADIASEALEGMIDAQRAFEKGGVSEVNKVAMAFKLISKEVDISKEEFMEAFVESRKTANSTEEALANLVGWNSELNKAVPLVTGILSVTKEQSDLEDNIYLDRLATNDLIKQYRADYMQLNLEASIGDLTAEEKAQKLIEVKGDQLQIEKQLIELRNNGVPNRQDGEDIAVLERRQQLLEKLQTQLESLYNVEQKQGSGAAVETIRERIRIRNEALKDELQQIEDSFKAEMLRASTLEDVAERDAALAAARVDYAESVSEANLNAANDISLMEPVLKKNQHIVEKAVDDLRRTGAITQTEGLEIFSKATSDFIKSQGELNDLLKDDTITQAAYEDKTDALRDAFQLVLRTR